MQISCRKCGASIPSPNINLQTLFAKCGQCDQVFSIANQFARPLLLQPLPKNLIVEKDDRGLFLRWRWFTVKTIPLLLIAIFFNVVLWAGIMAVAIENGTFPFELILIPHYWAGLLIGCMVVAHLLNRTMIYVTRKQLHVRSRPIPSFHGWNLSSADIQQLYVKEAVSRNQKNESTFSVYALYDCNQALRLVGGLHSADLALQIEAQIETFLGIEDVPIHGEVPRR